MVSDAHVTEAVETTETLRTALFEAIEKHAPLQLVQRLYVRFVFSRLRNKVHTGAALGIDRRTIQRWARQARVRVAA